MMITLLEELETSFGVSLDPNLMLEQRTIRNLTMYLAENGIVDPDSFSGAPSPTNIEEPPSPSCSVSSTAVNRFFTSNSASTPSKIAIIGQACRFAQSPTLESLWDHLSSKTDLITTPSKDRWNTDDPFFEHLLDTKLSCTAKGGYLNDIAGFDAGFFNISDEEAQVLDPQQRILLELTQELLDRSGYKKDNIKGTNTSVYLGAKDNNYVRYYDRHIPLSMQQYTLVNSIGNMMAARISDFYDLKGLSKTLDTACSSSLVAVHEACQTIQNGESSLAIAGGIFLITDSYAHIGFSRAQVLSDDGTAYVFDERAKGFVIGEGAGLILLKDYQEAVNDGDNILGTILGSAVNNDGKTMGLTVPNQEGQKAVIREAINKSQISPETIGYFEAHGTGTLLGDPIEVKAASEVYREYTDNTQYCAIGSVKSNIGHTMTSAGIAGLIKILLSMKHQQLLPTLHCEKPHPRFNFDKSPFYPILDLKRWDSIGDERRAAISSFGFGGSNCHMILAERNHKSPQKSLPLTPFRRKQYWLGKPIDEIEPDKLELDYYTDLPGQFDRKELTKKELQSIVGGA